MVTLGHVERSFAAGLRAPEEFLRSAGMIGVNRRTDEPVGPDIECTPCALKGRRHPVNPLDDTGTVGIGRPRHMLTIFVNTHAEKGIVASQAVIDLFLEEESQSLAMLGDFIGKPVSMQVESSYTQEQYDIILM